MIRVESKADLDRSNMSGMFESKLDANLLGDYRTQITYFGGIIERQNMQSFKKLLFRATKGKVFAQYFPMTLRPEDLLPEDKSFEHEMVVYIIMFEEGLHMRGRILKIC